MPADERPPSPEAVRALIDEAARRSSILWLRYGDERLARPAWHVWREGAVYVVANASADGPGRGGDAADDGVADDRVTDDRVTDEGVTDDRVTDDRVTDDRVTDDRVTDDRVTDDRVTDDRVTDDRVTGSREPRGSKRTTDSGGTGEQWLPGIGDAARVTVICRAKDSRARLVTWRATVSRLTPRSPEWEAAAVALRTERLNAGDAATLVDRWAEQAVIVRIDPTGEVLQTA